MAEDQRTQSDENTFTEDFWSCSGSGALPWGYNALCASTCGTNEYEMDDWIGERRFDWNTGEPIIPASHDSRSMGHPGDQTPSQAVLHNPLSISTNCVNPATSTASVSPSNVCDQSEQATEMDYQSNASDREGVGILPWIRMDRYSQNRLEKSYSETPEPVKEGQDDDLELRREIWQSLQGQSTEAVMFNGQRVFSKVCNAGMLRGMRCMAILVVLSKDAEVDWSKYACYKCENREASRKVRLNKVTKDTGGRKVPRGQARQKAGSQRTREGSVMTWESGDPSTVISDVIKAQKLLAAE